jgi:hypothetical protein
MSAGKWLNNIGRIIKKKDGGFFMVFERQQDKAKQYIGESPFPLTINEGDFFQLKAKKDDLQRLVDTGKMSQETANKIAETVRFEISRAPAKTDGPPLPAKKANDDGVNF